LGTVLTPGSHQHLAQFSAEELTAVVEEAHRHGLPITARAHGTEGIRNAVAAEVNGSNTRASGPKMVSTT
jgi:imidazolonepropionase-like amidohydrolase